MAHARYAGGGTGPNHGQLISGSELTTFNTTTTTTTTTTTGVSERQSGAWDSFVVQRSHKWDFVRLRTDCGGEDAGLARICQSCRIVGSPGRWC